MYNIIYICNMYNSMYNMQNIIQYFWKSILVLKTNIKNKNVIKKIHMI